MDNTNSRWKYNTEAPLGYPPATTELKCQRTMSVITDVINDSYFGRDYNVKKKSLTDSFFDPGNISVLDIPVHVAQ